MIMIASMMMMGDNDDDDDDDKIAAWGSACYHRISKTPSPHYIGGFRGDKYLYFLFVFLSVSVFLQSQNFWNFVNFPPKFPKRWRRAPFIQWLCPWGLKIEVDATSNLKGQQVNRVDGALPFLFHRHHQHCHRHHHQHHHRHQVNGTIRASPHHHQHQKHFLGEIIKVCNLFLDFWAIFDLSIARTQDTIH